jgi:uncharacterized protein YndB with AHSA1/START domain
VDARNKSSLMLTLPSDLEFTLTRVFDAPRRLVFEAWTEPTHMRQWYGCGMAELIVCDIDLRVGGFYRFTMRQADGQNGTIQGIYREVAAPARLIYTQGYVAEGFTSPIALVTTSFAEADGKTTLTSTALHDSRADRDMHLASGVEHGAAASLDSLEAHLRKMAPSPVS